MPCCARAVLGWAMLPCPVLYSAVLHYAVLCCAATMQCFALLSLRDLCSLHYGVIVMVQCMAAGNTESSAEKHAAVLGLKAFVLTSPYDVPAWLPEVLMALVKASGEPAPVKSTVR